MRHPSLVRIIRVIPILFGILGSQPAAASDTAWPHPIPCRIQPGPNPDLVVMTLGPVETPLAQGVFDPATDTVRLRDGTVIEHYYRDRLGIRYYRPLDKRAFPRPPSGWCSWYYYYQEIDAREILANARWMARNLRDYGAEYIQIDDGWQGTGHGLGENRDWTTVNRRFAPGMDALAAAIRALGFKAGLWLAPHGQSNPRVVARFPDVFLVRPDGRSVTETWVGTYLVDPSSPAAHRYLTDLFHTLVRWGYDYFKIDGQPIVVREYRKHVRSMRHPDDPDRLYRQTLKTIRAAIGPERYLLTSWGTALEAAGLVNGARTGGDVFHGWLGFGVAMQATLQHYFLHNIVWYSDPDVLLVRPPLRLEQARAWATLLGLTGQALMASDRMMDLPPARVELLRRIFPATDIRPLDLYPLDQPRHIWDLKIHHRGRRYDVVGVFNLDRDRTRAVLLRWSDLGLDPDRRVHVFDFWEGTYLGAWPAGFVAVVPPTAVRVLTLVPEEPRPVLVSTSRHITQGWVDLQELAWDAASRTWTGVSQVVAGDPYELRFAFPHDRNYRIVRARAGDLPVTVRSHQGWAAVRITPNRTGTVAWSVTFAPTEMYRYPVRPPRRLTAQRVGVDGLDLRWQEQYYLTAGYQVYRDDRLLGYTPEPVFPIRHVDPRRTLHLAVRSVWYDGTTSEPTRLTVRIADTLPAVLPASDIEPQVATAGWRWVRRNRAVSGAPLAIRGTTYAHGFGTHAPSRIELRLWGLFQRLTGWVGIDDHNGADRGRVEFLVFGDGQRLWSSGAVTKGQPPVRLDLPVAGVDRLVLVVTDGGDGRDFDHADWADLLLHRTATPQP